MVFDSLKDMVKTVAQDTIGDQSDNLHGFIMENEKCIRVTFFRWCPVVEGFRDVGSVKDGSPERLRETWRKVEPVPVIANEVEELASQAYDSHLDWLRKAREEGLA